MSENMALWDKVCKTDPRFTKKAKKGQFSFTAISPMYQVKRATEAFGPQGLGWGVVIGSEKFSEREHGDTIILNYDAVLFFIIDGQRGEIPIHASEKACYMTQSNYLKIDDEVRKKVVTNAKTKGLSELGISADVFLGEFDDPNYINFRNWEEQIKQSEDREAEIADKTIEFNQWCNEEIGIYKAVQSASSLAIIAKKHHGAISNKCAVLGLEPNNYLARFENARANAETRLQEGS